MLLIHCALSQHVIYLTGPLPAAAMSNWLVPLMSLRGRRATEGTQKSLNGRALCHSVYAIEETLAIDSQRGFNVVTTGRQAYLN